MKGITHCYICNAEKIDTFKNLMEFRTYYTNNTVVAKISMLMGNNFAIILTENDIICSNCMHIFNAIDKLELELEQGRVILINNLAKTYHLNFDELDNVASCVNNKFYDKYFCSVCNFSTVFVEEYFQHIISFDCSNRKLKIIPDIKSDTNEIYNCILCEFNTVNKNYFIKHSKTHVDPNHVCLQCLKTLYNYHELQKHIKEHPMFNCRICGHPFSNYSKLKCHLLKCSRSDQFKTYKCSICKIDFFNYVPYRKHIISKHGKKFRKLSIINEKIENNPQSIEQNETENLLNDLLYFESNKSLKTEVNHEDTSDLIGILENLSPYQLGNDEKKSDGETAASKELKTVYICAICSFETPLDTEMKLHITSHVKDEYKCERCSSTFKTAHTLELHARRHLDGAQPVKCGICGCECIDKLHLRSHKKNVHKIHLTCNVCKIVCRTKKELQIHYQKHSGNGKLECDICKQTFSREIMYTCHKEYSHRLDNKCKFCRKELSTLKELRMHERRHKRQGNFDLKCPYCEKTLKTKTGLRVHLAKHTGEYKFFCEVCGRGCMSLMVLQEHMGVHTKEERYVCDVCGKKFCYNATYRIHRLWHDNPKPYDCADCGQKFAHTSLLAVHRRREHTGERPYVCFDCNMTFTRSSSLKRHNRIHTGERPYVCIWCNKGFIEKKLWVKHLVNEHEDYSEVNNKQKCEYKMVIRPETEETTEIEKGNISNQTHEEMQEFIIIGNHSMENMIFYGLPQQVIDEPKGIEMENTQHSNAILLPSDVDVDKSDEQQTEVKFTVADGYQIIQDDIKSEPRLLEGVDEANIVIKTENGDMVIRNGQLVPLTDAY